MLFLLKKYKTPILYTALAISLLTYVILLLDKYDVGSKTWLLLQGWPIQYYFFSSAALCCFLGSRKTIFAIQSIPDFLKHPAILPSMIACSVLAGLIWLLPFELPKANDPLELKTAAEIIRNILLGSAALIAFPFLVWRTQTAEKTSRTAIESHNTAIESHNLEIYSKSIEQLGSEYESVRLGSIHTFKELLQNNKENRELAEKTCDVLHNFMEEHSRVSLLAYANWREQKSDTQEEAYRKAVATAKTYYSQFYEIIRLLSQVYDNNVLHFDYWKHKTYAKIFLHQVPWVNKDLEKSNLQGANLQLANLAGANLAGADLVGADLAGANLAGADLVGADLIGANLLMANLQGAYLLGAKLLGAKLLGAKLRCADLQGAVLRGTVLQSADFSCAEYNTKRYALFKPTQFPEDFNPKAHGMVDISEEEAEKIYAREEISTEKKHEPA